MFEKPLCTDLSNIWLSIPIILSNNQDYMVCVLYLRSFNRHILFADIIIINQRDWIVLLIVTVILLFAKLRFDQFKILNDDCNCITKWKSYKHSKSPSNWTNESNCVVNQVFFLNDKYFWRSIVVSKVSTMFKTCIPPPFNISWILGNFTSFGVWIIDKFIEAWCNLLPCTNIFFIGVTNWSTVVKTI